MICSTKIYNYSNLNNEDKQIVQAQYLMINSVRNLLDEYEVSKELAEDTLEQITYEQRIKALEDAEEYMLYDIHEYIMYAIDGYENTVNEVETDDPLYGLFLDLGESQNDWNHIRNAWYRKVQFRKIGFLFNWN